MSKRKEREFDGKHGECETCKRDSFWEPHCRCVHWFGKRCEEYEKSREGRRLFKDVEGLEDALTSFERVEAIDEIIILGNNGGIRRVILEK